MLRYSNYLGKLRTDIRQFRDQKLPWRSIVLNAQDTITGFISTYTFNETTNAYVDEYVEFFNEVLNKYLKDSREKNILESNHKYLMEYYNYV
jgi:predicted GNAT family N-acyltransferase